MADKPAKEKYSQVKIVMERSFENFGEEKQEEFLDDIAKLSRSSKKKIRKKKYRSGCVVFEGELPMEGATRLLELFGDRESAIDSADRNEFLSLLEKHRISLIHGESGSTVQIITSRKSRPEAFVQIDRSARIAPALCDLQNCELVAVTQSHFEIAESSADKFGASRWYPNPTWQELLANEEIDAVYTATPGHSHALRAIAAAETEGICYVKTTRLGTGYRAQPAVLCYSYRSAIIGSTFVARPAGTKQAPEPLLSAAPKLLHSNRLSCGHAEQLARQHSRHAKATATQLRLRSATASTLASA